MPTYNSEHYIFNYQAGSLAEKDIQKISAEQEKCFSKICKTLKVNYEEKIIYYLLDSPSEVGRLYGGSEPINGFAIWGENKIYAVYNEEIKCIGYHEDVHLISFMINSPTSDFVVEGLAMYFDESWWGIPNDVWASYYKDNEKLPLIEDMLDNNVFANLDCAITYPIAGAFTKYLITTYGMDKYISFYKTNSDMYQDACIKIFNCTLKDLEQNFWLKESQVQYDLTALQLLHDKNNINI